MIVTNIEILLVALIIIAIELLYFRIAKRCNIVDKPNLRSSHNSVTLRGGGIIFPLAMAVQALFFGMEYVWFFIALMAVSIVSFIDDVRSVPNSVRLIVQLSSMLLLCYQWGIVSWSTCGLILVALVFCTGVINAYNFMDGINGITGGYSLAVLVPLCVINERMPFVDASIIIVAIISVLVFCFFNFRTRAKCFAGDVGAISMAFIMVFIIGKLIIETKDFTYILFLAMYGVDTILTIIHRIILHEHLGQAHRKHVYQLMANELKIPHTIVSMFYVVLQLLISIGLIWLPINKWLYVIIVLIVLCTMYVLFKKKYYHLHEEYLNSRKCK